MSPNSSWHLTNSNGNHIVKVCPNDTLQAEAVTIYVKDGLLNEEAVIIFARSSLRKTVIANLNKLGIDVDHYKVLGQLKFFEAEHILACFHSEGVLDESIFLKLIGTPIQEIKSKFGKVMVFGEIVNVLWKNAEHDAAMQLDECWNNLCQRIDFSFLCAYSLESFNSAAFDESIALLYQYHKHLLPVHADIPAIEKEETTLQAFGSAWNSAIERFRADKTISPFSSPKPFQ